MTAFEAHQIYKSIHFHFSSDYDCFKYNFKVRGTPETFAANRSRFLFKKLARKHLDTDRYKQFLAANFFENPNIYILDLLQEEATDRYLRREKIQQSLSYYFKKDLEFLFSKEADPNLLLKPKKGGYPPLISHLWSDEITLETFLIIADLLKAFPTWDRVIQDDIAWPACSKRLKKYLPFLNYDKGHMKKIISEMLKVGVKNDK